MDNDIDMSSSNAIQLKTQNRFNRNNPKQSAVSDSMAPKIDFDLEDDPNDDDHNDGEEEEEEDEDGEDGKDSACSRSDLVSLPIPEVIEMLKNLAACNEKQYKWEQSTLKLGTIPESDPNKQQLMEIIEYVNHKPSTREKAIYLYQQLGKKCRQHGNYIGAAKAFERAAGLLMDLTDQCQVSRMDDQTMQSTIRCLESAIHNYDAIHKYKHAGTLHYRCSRILRLMNANHELVQQHHIKALEYFTKPDHELKQRKRVNGFKISCYSSCSQWAQTMTRTRMSKIKSKTHSKLMTTTHKTITTNHRMIKFHHHGSGPAPSGSTRDENDVGGESDEELELADVYEDDSDDEPRDRKQPTTRTTNYSNSKVSFEFQNEENHHTFGHHSMEDMDYLDQYFTDPPTNDDCDEDQDNQGGGLKTPPIVLFPNESMPTTPTTPSSLASSIPDVQHQIKSSGNNYSTTMDSIFSNRHQKDQQQQQSSSSAYIRESRLDHHHHHHHRSHVQEQRFNHRQSSYSHHHHNQKQRMYGSSNSTNRVVNMDQPPPQSQKTPIYRCIEDRIESAKKLVKKLHKLCPFYEVSTKGGDAGRVYCRICDRYLGAVSSTLKNHINTQEHRQAFEDSHQASIVSQQRTIQPLTTVPSTIAIQTLPAPNPVPLITYPLITNVNQNVGSNQQSNNVPPQSTEPSTINYLNSPSTPVSNSVVLQQPAPPPPPLPPPPSSHEPETSTTARCDTSTACNLNNNPEYPQQPSNLYQARSVLINPANNVGTNLHHQHHGHTPNSHHTNPNSATTNAPMFLTAATNSMLEFVPYATTPQQPQHHLQMNNHLNMNLIQPTQQLTQQLAPPQQFIQQNQTSTTANRPVLAYH